MSSFTVKSILLLFCGVTLLRNFAYGRLDLNDDGIVGVSQENLKDYLIKAIKGFQKVMLQGDDELNYPIMDPCEVKDVSFDHVDLSGNKKYKLDFSNKDTAILKGLADFKITFIEASAKDMKLTLNLIFNNLYTKFPYTLDGYMIKNFMPVYGEGFIELCAQHEEMSFSVDLGTDHGFIMVEKALAFRYRNDIRLNATGIMDLPDPFATVVLDDVLDHWEKEHGTRVLSNYVRNVVEEAVGGMTTEEFYDYLDYFVKKYDQQ